ncbi:helix-turn-helix transcriptional regulator [Vibrio plantisponsor]|uniref:Helix-turn-helix transcriptional regulator n=1 Tax=Vibrio plantisponsor TaxID=664643 RepID=A0ABU4IGD1_9VIBR|nr:helix-turn-helix transcriptional regulator [Vibrio plantisponsor]MDW6017541.1 helix-turn-helix transcriptional regulator [Vibrio plantisponsor]NNM40376.1 helix-turn-helix transcriptional regulator [Vibrio plantisponsor]
MENPIPARLKAARKKAKITQKDLGVKIGMEESSASGRMNHYEKGRHVPDIGTLTRMAEELGVPLNYFFCKDEVTAELVCLIDKLSNEDKENLLSMLENKKSSF